MARSVNSVQLLGNVGADPSVNSTQAGVLVASFSIATTEKWTDQRGDKRERTEWHRIVAWNRGAEIIRDYVKKGDKLFVQGKLQTRSWEDKESGEKKYSTEIVMKDVTLLENMRSEAPAEPPAAAPAKSSGGKRGGKRKDAIDEATERAMKGTEITDDDIPF